MAIAETPRDSKPSDRGPGEVDVVVVGGGHNGLTAACYMAREGLDVLVLEAFEEIGGMTATRPVVAEAPDHLFNEGAIQLTGIFRLSGIAQDLNLNAFGLNEIPVDPAHLQLAPDGTSLGIWKDREKTIKELARFSKNDAQAWREISETTDAIIEPILAFMNHHPTRVLNLEMMKALLGSARSTRKLSPVLHYLTASHTELLDELFETELPKGALAAMAAFQRMDQDMTAAVAIIYLGVVQRIANAMPVGGTVGLPKALAKCLEHHGGRVRTSARVDEILVQGKKATGVRLDNGDVIRARQGILTTANAKHVLLDLLPDGTLPPHIQRRAEDIAVNKTQATSLKINVALKGRVDASRFTEMRDDGLDPCAVLTAWHTLEEQSRAWDELSRGEWPETVPTSCCIFPSRVDPTQAPEGQDTFWYWSGVIPVLPKTPWEDVRDEIGDKVLKDCAQYFDGIDTLEIGRTVLGGPDIEERFNAPWGNVYHVDPIPTRFGALKPALGLGSYRTPVENLYLSGASTHPVGGVCSLPGKLAAETLMRDKTSAIGRLTGKARSAAGARS